MPQHPPINFAELQIDPERLERALALTVESFEGVDTDTGEIVPQPGCYSVTPASAASEKQGIVGYWVDLYSHDVPRCDCGDHTYRDTICKHMLACLLHENNPTVCAALAQLMGDLEEDLRVRSTSVRSAPTTGASAKVTRSGASTTTSRSTVPESWAV